jgi:hypothetical protein
MQLRRHFGSLCRITAATGSECSQTENIWLRTKRYNASGKLSSGTGGVCYLYFPAHPSPAQRRALASSGVR